MSNSIDHISIHCYLIRAIFLPRRQKLNRDWFLQRSTILELQQRRCQSESWIFFLGVVFTKCYASDIKPMLVLWTIFFREEKMWISGNLCAAVT